MNEELEDRVAAYLDGTLEDEEAFVRELRESPEARRYLLLAAHTDVALYDLAKASPRRSRLWIAAAALVAAGLLWMLWPRDVLISGEKVWPDGTRLRTGPDTVLRDGDPLMLERGSFTAVVSPRERAFVARTPDAEIRVLGTALRLSAGPTRLEVSEGKVALKRLSDGRSVEVAGGFFALSDLVARPLGRVAAPDGTPGGDGSFDRPWDLGTALAAPLRPGETLWLRAGIYRGAFKSLLRGEEKAPIAVRGLPGARIDGGIAAFGAWTVFRDLEIFNSPGEGLSMLGRGHKAINLVVHDTGGAGIGFREAVGDGGEVYGCLLWGNRTAGLSAQNAEGRRIVRDNLVFRNGRSGIFVFADKGRADGFELEGNVAFDHPEWSIVATGGENPLRGFRMSGNLVFGRGFVRVGLVPGGRVEDAAIRDNTFVLGEGDEAFHVYQGEDVAVTGNTIVGRDVLARWTPGPAGRRDWNRNMYHATVGPGRFLLTGGPTSWEAWRTSTGFDGDSTLVAAPPEKTRVIVRPNLHEEGRAHVVVLNWERAAAVDVPLRMDGSWIARDVRTYLGPPVARGSGPVRLPTPEDVGVFVISRE
jgi:hypothetical protein